MNTILDNETYPVEERLAMAKELLLLKDKEIAKLKAKLFDIDSELTHIESDRNWAIGHQMGT